MSSTVAPTSAYAEAAYAWDIGIRSGPERARPWRLQWGLDWVPSREVSRTVPFVFGCDFESRQEVGWNISSTVHLAYILWRDDEGNSVHAGVLWHRGRSVVLQNHTKRVQWWGFEFSFDF